MNANQIKKFRLSQGWTQQTLADKVGVDLFTVWRWENFEAEPSDLSQEKLRKLKRETLGDQT